MLIELKKKKWGEKSALEFHLIDCTSDCNLLWWWILIMCWIIDEWNHEENIEQTLQITAEVKIIIIVGLEFL